MADPSEDTPQRQRETIVANAIYEALLKRQPWSTPYVEGEPALHRKTTIDGDFHLFHIAQTVLRRLEQANCVRWVEPLPPGFDPTVWTRGESVIEGAPHDFKKG